MTEAITPHPLPWTVQDLDCLSDDGGWSRYEIIEGELQVTRAPHFRHQGAASGLTILLGTWSRQTGLGITVQTPGVIFSATDAVVPDLIWISQTRLVQGTDAAGHFVVAPELIVEILSPGEVNQQRDRSMKLGLYSRYGVQEYWIVSWQDKTVEIYRQSGPQLGWISTLQEEDILTSPLLPGFSASVAQIFL